MSTNSLTREEIAKLKAEFLLLSADKKTLKKEDGIKLMNVCGQKPSQGNYEAALLKANLDKNNALTYEEVVELAKQIWVYETVNMIFKIYLSDCILVLNFSLKPKPVSINSRSLTAEEIESTYDYLYFILASEDLIFFNEYFLNKLVLEFKVEFKKLSADGKTIKKEDGLKLLLACGQSPAQTDFDSALDKANVDKNNVLTLDESIALAKQVWIHEKKKEVNKIIFKFFVSYILRAYQK